ncbi:response regulator [Paenibacillus ginsengarvi]
MYSIGEISKIVNISVDALRYYDEIGLLKPHRTDAKSRYRYYSEDQVRDLVFITEMKAYGFSLDAIRELLATGDPARIEDALKLRSSELKREHNKIQTVIQQLNQRLHTRKEDGEPLKKAAVLIVDDAPFMRHMLGDILGKDGYTVIGEASCGEDGIAKFRELRPDIVVMDIHMPDGMDGFEATRAIKEIDPEAKIVICSAKGQVVSVLTGLASGARAFVVKPFQAQFLREAVTDLLADKRQPSTRLVAGWLSDERLLAELPGESLGQEAIGKLLDLCSLPEADQNTRLMELLAEL